MKKMKNDPDMLEEYDFSGGIRGKYARHYAEGTNVVVIDPDIIEYFPDNESVNNALRSLAAIITNNIRGTEPLSFCHRQGNSGKQLSLSSKKLHKRIFLDTI